MRAHTSCVSSAYCRVGSLTQAQKSLDEDLLAFVPTAVLCPGLANLLALRGRVGISNPAHGLVTLLDPIESGGLRMVSAGQPSHLEQLETFLLATGFDALLMKSTEGEPFANPKQRPRIKFFRQGEAIVLFEEEMLSARGALSQPAARRRSGNRGMDRGRRWRARSRFRILW